MLLASQMIAAPITTHNATPTSANQLTTVRAIPVAANMPPAPILQQQLLPVDTLAVARTHPLSTNTTTHPSHARARAARGRPARI